MSSTSEAIRPCPHCGSSCAVQHQYCPTCGFPVGTVNTANDDRFVGKTLPGGYHILDLISVGGMGRVYRAQQSALGRTVAVKIIHPHLLSDENSALRFMTEARAASQLNHPNSVAVFDFGRTDDGQPYLVMEFLRGKDLARVAYEEGALPFPRIVDVLRQVLAALGEAHDLGIVHRDLKPENVILEPLRRGGDFVKVVDFGLAKLRADTQQPGVTSPGIVCGTPDYMAPEQGRGDPIDGRSDLYAVGVMFFQLLTGRLPFEADSPTQVVMMHLTVPVPDPRQVAPERHIPDSLVEVALKALAKDNRKRYQDAQEFSDALTRALTIAESVPPERASLPPQSIHAATVTCSACGQSVPPAKFCGECGARLPIRSGIPDGAAPVFPLPFVAREEDLNWLDDKRRQLAEELVAARVVGEPGSGKSRLLAELLSLAKSENDAVAAAGPDPYHAEVAYYALREAIKQLARLSPNDIEAGRFERVRPEARAGLDEIFGRQAHNDGAHSLFDRRETLAEALRWALCLAANRSRRVLLTVDDIDDIDGPSRNALLDVISDPPVAAVLLVVSHRPGFDASPLGPRTSPRMLGGLPPPAVSRLLAQRPRMERSLLGEGGKGVLPMYVDQVLRYSLEGGSDPPQRLADLIALRVDTLESNARRTLQALAVLGDRVPAAVVAELLPRSELPPGSIEDLVQKGMIERADGKLSCSHPLLREIVLGGIPVAVRRELHKKAIAVSEKLAQPLEACAAHAYESGDSFQALVLLEQMAGRASQRGDSRTEVLCLRRCVEVARKEISRGELDDPLRALLIFSRKLGGALTRAGNFADAEGVLREAMDIAGPSGPDRARLLSALAHVAHGRKRDHEAFTFLEQAIELARQSGAHELVANLSDTRRVWGI
ncbi:MAG TPA: protein kinase [Polyangiaceae bacterium]|nr:protein kinase [Polyangiaceae bacterium]